MALSDDKLRELIAADEDQYHDRKSLLHGPPDRKQPRDRREVRDEIAEYVAGFANAEGGTLILGVEDDGSLSGHRYPAEVVDAMLAVPTQRLVPALPPGRRVALDGVELLVFEVESVPRAVAVTGDGYPYRAGDSTLQFSEEKINAIKDRGLIESAEARKASVDLGALDAALIERARASSGLDVSVDEYLVRRRLADRFGSMLVLRNAAVWLFAARPETIEHPNASIRVFRVAGTERRTGARHNVQEFPRFEGNLPTVLQQVRALLDTLIQKSAKLHDLFFKEMPEYPDFAWQEALVNAVAHRDYAIEGQSVEVWLFADRLEVLSPGGLVPEVSIDDLRIGKPGHASRNPRIARVLADLAVMRDQGEGIPRMFEEMELSYLQLPQLDFTADRRFQVVLRNEPIYSTADPSWATQVRGLPLLVTQKRALVALWDREFANADYATLNGLDRDSSYRELRELVDQGFLVSDGSGAGTRYRIDPQGAPTPSRPPTALELFTARMRRSGYVTNTDYRETFGVDRSTAKRTLASLVGLGVLVKEGERRATRYLPGPRWTAAMEQL